MEKELIEFYEKMKSNAIDKVGYILLPSIDGFKVFEIPAEILDYYLKLESLRLKSINSSPCERKADSNNSKAKEICERCGNSDKRIYHYCGSCLVDVMYLPKQIG